MTAPDTDTLAGLLAEATPGEWLSEFCTFEVFNADHGPIKVEISSDYTLLAAVYADSPDDPNARLIALAPELAAETIALRAQTAKDKARIERLEAALRWYGEQARLARLIHSEGDVGRNALARDGGEYARAALEDGE